MTETATQLSVHEQIKALLNENENDLDTPPDTAGGEGTEAKDDGGDDGGSRELDQSQPDDDAGLEDDPEAQAPEDTDDETDEPVDLDYLAGILDTDKADLYDLVIPLGDGETTTLGELKDARKEYGTIAEARAETNKEIDKYQRDLLATRSQISAMMQVANTPEKQSLLNDMIQAAGPMQTNYERQQEQILLDAMPEWQDAATRTEQEAAIVELGSTYGFSEPEMTYTKDARTLRLLRDFVQARAKLAEMQESAKRIHAVPNAPGKRASGKLTKRRMEQRMQRARQGTHQDKASFVRDLISKG